MDGDVPKLHRFLSRGSVNRNRVAAVYLVKRNVKGQAALDSGAATCVWDNDAPVYLPPKQIAVSTIFIGDVQVDRCFILPKLCCVLQPLLAPLAVEHASVLVPPSVEQPFYAATSTGGCVDSTLACATERQR